MRFVKFVNFIQIPKVYTKDKFNIHPKCELEFAGSSDKALCGFGGATAQTKHCVALEIIKEQLRW